MAGSMAWFVYTDDDGELSAVNLDEDTGNNTAFGFDPYTGTPPLSQLSRGFKMRRVNAVQTTGDGAGFRYRSFPCGSDEAPAYDGSVAVFTVNGLSYSITSTRGEQERKPTATNSGLQGSSPTVGEGGDGGVEG